jgi:hypothetical protein
MSEEGHLVGEKETYFDQNQFMKQNTFSHVRDGDARHDDQRSDHVSLSPGFEDQAIWVGRFLHHALREESQWSHRESVLVDGRVREEGRGRVGSET